MATNKIELFQSELRRLGIGAYLVTDSLNQFYLTGFRGSSGYLLVTQSGSWLITDFRYRDYVTKELPDISLILSEAPRKLEETLARKIHSLGLSLLFCEGHILTYDSFNKLRQTLVPLELVSGQSVVEKMRLIKGADELDIMRDAAQIADKTFTAILSELAPGVSEVWVANRIETLLRDFGAESSSFTTIVASGKNSALPHAKPSDKKLASGEFVTLDFGALYKGYCSDMTRTVVLGAATPKHQKIYNLVREAQTRVIDNIKAGLTTKEADSLARDYLSQSGYNDEFGHGTGHGLGLAVHEAPYLSVVDNKTKLEAGMVVTVEPGLYLTDWGGVRIEDDILITADGCKVLTQSTKELLVL